MIRSINIFILFLVCIITSHTSCTKKADEIAGPAGVQGPPGNNVQQVGPSAITGYVRLMDQYGFLFKAGDSVSATANSGDSSVTVVTDAAGKFILPNMPAGSYAIRLKRSSYDSFVVNVVHSGGNTDKFIGIVQLSQSLTTHITGETVSLLDSPIPNDSFKIVQLNIQFDGPAFSPPYARNFWVYFSRRASVSSQDYDFLWNNGNFGFTYSNSLPAQFPTDNLVSNGLNYHKGDTIYMKTYVAPPAAVDTSWYDVNNYKTISYPYTGDSVLRYFIWPN